MITGTHCCTTEIVIKLVEWLHLLWGYIQESCLTWKNNSTSRKCCTILLAACRCQSRTLCCALLSNKINSQSHTLTHAAHPGLRRKQAVWLYPVDEMHVSPSPLKCVIRLSWQTWLSGLDERISQLQHLYTILNARQREIMRENYRHSKCTLFYKCVLPFLT